MTKFFTQDPMTFRLGSETVEAVFFLWHRGLLAWSTSGLFQLRLLTGAFRNGC